MKKQILLALLLTAAFGAGCSAAQPVQTANKQADQAQTSQTATSGQEGYGAMGQDENGDVQSASLGQTIEADKTYTLDDVAKHSSDTDCWMAINGMVYDVTSYIDNHPGGAAILKGCGKDATEMFKSVKKHDPKGQEMLPRFQIGSIK